MGKEKKMEESMPDNMTGNVSAPAKGVKKPRLAPVRYKPAAAETLSGVVPVGKDNPADKPLQYNQGGIRVAGIEIDNAYGDVVVKDRTKGLFWKNVTLRQLLHLLDTQYGDAGK